MQIILRKDLLDVENWPVGPLIAQGSHAATALMHLYKDHQAMKDYTEDWEHMRKVGNLSRSLICWDECLEPCIQQAILQVSAHGNRADVAG